MQNEVSIQPSTKVEQFSKSANAVETLMAEYASLFLLDNTFCALLVPILASFAAPVTHLPVTFILNNKFVNTCEMQTINECVMERSRNDDSGIARRPSSL